MARLMENLPTDPRPLEKIKRTFHVSWLIRIQLVKSEKLATKFSLTTKKKSRQQTDSSTTNNDALPPLFFFFQVQINKKLHYNPLHSFCYLLAASRSHKGLL
jgi:hypothetical protein